MRVAAVVVAAGRGERFGGSKQFVEIDHRTMAAHSVELARSVAKTVVLVVPENYDGDGEGADVVVTGASTRSGSVRAGLAAVGDAEIVVIHDAARPFATPELFRAVVEVVRGEVAGAIPGMPVTDTVKRVVSGENSRVIETVSREGLMYVQTPQAFRRIDLERAHANGSDATDDAALVEQLGLTIVVVPGESANIKVTVPSDLAMRTTSERSST